MAIKVIHLRQYTKAAKESHLEGSHFNSCLKAELAEIKDDVVYFRNYEDTKLDYIEYCFTRLSDRVIFNYMSYVEDDEQWQLWQECK